MAAAVKTNAMRALDQRGVPYEALVYSTSDEFKTAVEVASLLGLPPDQVYKTIVVLSDGGARYLVMVAAHREIDLKLLARSAEEKRLRLASLKEAESLTGLRVGCISALALLGRPFTPLLDRPAATLEHIVVSAGQRGQQIRLATTDLLAVTVARLVDATAATPAE